MKNKQTIFMFLITLVLISLFIGVLYANIKINEINDTLIRQKEVNEYILNRIEGVGYEES